MRLVYGTAFLLVSMMMTPVVFPDAFREQDNLRCKRTQTEEQAPLQES